MIKIDIVKIKVVKEGILEVEKDKISEPNDAYLIATKFLEGVDREYLIVLNLNTKNRVTSLNTVSMGSLNSSIVHPREVFKPAILGNAASIIIAHNHPSGDPNPSKEDISITNRLKECGKLLGIELLDHIIVGENTYISFKEEGII